MDDPTSPHRRRDSNLAEIIQLGITLHALTGRREATHYLVNKGVDSTIIERVLSPGHPHRLIARKDRPAYK